MENSEKLIPSKNKTKLSHLLHILIRSTYSELYIYQGTNGSTQRTVLPAFRQHDRQYTPYQIFIYNKLLHCFNQGNNARKVISEVYASSVLQCTVSEIFWSYETIM